jgi:hypothetical protein
MRLRDREPDPKPQVVDAPARERHVELSPGANPGLDIKGHHDFLADVTRSTAAPAEEEGDSASAEAAKTGTSRRQANRKEATIVGLLA